MLFPVFMQFQDFQDRYVFFLQIFKDEKTFTIFTDFRTCGWPESMIDGETSSVQFSSVRQD